jgi:hypothetical protein
MSLDLRYRNSWPEIADLVNLALREDPVDIPGVQQRLKALRTILARLPGGKRGSAASFNGLYLRITNKVAQYVDDGLFRDPRFLIQLDVEFAKRYLYAVRAMATGDAVVPRCWHIVFIAGWPASSLAFAAAGVNAHVNFDLAFALLATLESQAAFPDEPSPQYHDYDLVNQIFRHEMPKLIRHFAHHDQYLDLIYHVYGRRNYPVEDRLVIATRGIAWDLCKETLWPVRKNRAELTRRQDRHDDMVAILGEAILSPLGRLTFGTGLDRLRRSTTTPSSGHMSASNI